jgi:hypothetical protein
MGSGREPLRQCRQASQAPEGSRARPRLAGRKSPGQACPAAQFPTKRQAGFARGWAAYREGGDPGSGASWKERRRAGSENNRPGSACRPSAANAPPPGEKPRRIIKKDSSPSVRVTERWARDRFGTASGAGTGADGDNVVSIGAFSRFPALRCHRPNHRCLLVREAGVEPARAEAHRILRAIRARANLTRYNAARG